MKKLNILSIEYEVNYVDKVDRKGDLGLSDFEQYKIYILKSQNDQEIKKTLLHEILECINHGFKINLRHEQIEKLEDAIYDTFKRNEIKEIFE